MSWQTESMMFVFVLGVIIFNAIGALCLKKGAKNFFIRFDKKNFSELFKNRLLLIGIILYSVSTIFFILALRLGELTTVYSLTSLSYALISVLSIYFLREHMNWYKWAGIFFIIIGVILVKV